MRKVWVTGLILASLEAGDFEGKDWFSLKTNEGIVNAKWKINDTMYYTIMALAPKQGDLIDLEVELKYNTKINGFDFGLVTGFRNQNDEKALQEAKNVKKIK